MCRLAGVPLVQVRELVWGQPVGRTTAPHSSLGSNGASEAQREKAQRDAALERLTLELDRVKTMRTRAARTTKKTTAGEAAARAGQVCAA